MNGLLRRAALPVNRDTRDGIRQTGGEPAGASDVSGLRADRVDTTEDDVFDRHRVDAGTLDQPAEHMSTKISGMSGGQAAAALSDSGAYGIDDVGLTSSHELHLPASA
jgi:hypothetical protein